MAVGGISVRTVPYSDVYDPDEDFDRWFTDGTAAAIGQWVRPGDAVLELGCATGRMSAVFAAMGATVTGVDIAAPYLARARGRRGPRWRLTRLRLPILPRVERGVVLGFPPR